MRVYKFKLFYELNCKLNCILDFIPKARDKMDEVVLVRLKIDNFTPLIMYIKLEKTSIKLKYINMKDLSHINCILGSR